MQSALDYLKRFPMFGEPGGFKPGLERVEALLSGLGAPHQDLPTVHIAGSNGKGSTATILASILEKAGLRTGLYTSPEIFSFTERIRINGQDISLHELEEAVERIQPVVHQVSRSFGTPTFFEVLTALSFWYFHHQQVELLVMEVGLGGRLDATNLCHSLMSIITNVSLEHTGILGHTLQEIAREKAGIIKRNQQVLTAAKSQEVVATITKRCQEMEAQLFLLGEDFSIISAGSPPPGQRFHYQGGENQYSDLLLPLLGQHQLENAALAVKASDLLTQHHFSIPEEALRQGLAAVQWPGRLELISQDPAILIDGAHNPGGMESLAHFLQHDMEYRHLYLLLGLLQDKDAHSIFQLLLPLATRVIVSKTQNQRARDPFQLAEVAREYSPFVLVEPDFQSALTLARSFLEKKDLLCITGSLYTMSLARRLLLEL